MRRKLNILLAVLLLTGVVAMAQMPRGKKLKTPSKTEQTQKKEGTTTKSNKGGSKKNNQQSAAEKQRRQQEEAERQRAEAEELRRQQEEAKRRPAEPTAYDVKFTCNVSEASIYIDGNDYGKPSGTRTLKTGSHQVKLMANGYEDYTATINVASGSTSFDFKMTRLPYVAKVETFTVNGVSFEMIFVEGGTFMMGAADDEQGVDFILERPSHKVTLSSYYIGKYEVTQELWQAVMGKKPSKFKNNPQNPVENVSWEKCQEFIRKLNQLTGRNFRLPTEAEWEYAARGGNQSRGYKYSGSDNVGSVAWYSDNSGETTHPVGQKSPNELGLYDMSGNIEEWCQDWLGDYSSGSQTNPKGPASGSHRVNRGGSWIGYGSNYCRVSVRSASSMSNSYYNVGLRLAL